ncbi:MAG: AmmeMemoRadiSam system radical SAM enzyme [Kiritimatiellales bacterium]|nr:AmmeMemoRadiSam system radical SAM enzyme [Kiritimatiellales bacterium]
MQDSGCEMIKPAKHWHVLDNGLIECTLCPRHCRIAEGKRGACFVRRRIGDELIAETYGRVCGLAVDPIEKKPLYHFLPGTDVLSFGTVGCNLTCGFCQNAHLSRAASIEGTRITPEQIAETALKYNCESVAFTYNEPTVFFEYAIDTAKACHERGLQTVAVTNGWIEPEPRKEFYAHIDAANVDLKAFTDTFYKTLCGATLQPVLDTLLYIRKETDVHLEVTTLLIPGHNDSPAEIDAMTKWAVANLGPDVPWHFSAYRPTPEWREAPPTPLDTLLQAQSIAKANGLQRIHLGNVGIAR